MTSLKKETSHLRLKLAEQVAIRQEIEMRMKWELEMLRKEAEEEQKKRKRLQSQVELIKNSESKKAQKSISPSKNQKGTKK